MRKQQEIDKELSSKTQYLCITSKYNQRLYLNSGSFFEENVYRFPERTRRLSTKEQCHGRCLRYKALLRQSRQSWVCFKSWFMAPLKSKACRDDGTLNETLSSSPGTLSEPSSSCCPSALGFPGCFFFLFLLLGVPSVISLAAVHFFRPSHLHLALTRITGTLCMSTCASVPFFFCEISFEGLMPANDQLGL